MRCCSRMAGTSASGTESGEGCWAAALPPSSPEDVPGGNSGAAVGTKVKVTVK